MFTDDMKSDDHSNLLHECTDYNQSTRQNDATNWMIDQYQPSSKYRHHLLKAIKHQRVPASHVFGW
jgi:hypothetical protein